MASQKLNPAQQAAGRARECDCLAAVTPETATAQSTFQTIGGAATAVVADLAERRVAWLLRRFPIGPSTAALVSLLHFGEA